MYILFVTYDSLCQLYILFITYNSLCHLYILCVTYNSLFCKYILFVTFNSLCYLYILLSPIILCVAFTYFVSPIHTLCHLYILLIVVPPSSLLPGVINPPNATSNTPHFDPQLLIPTTIQCTSGVACTIPIPYNGDPDKK